MKLNQFVEGSEYFNHLNKEEILKRNITSKKEKSAIASAYLLLKICFFLLAFISLIKLGYATKLRISRLQEIKNSYIYEKDKFINLVNQFDDLLSFQGEQRFMKDQDQMISRDVMRVIWR